MKRRKSAIGKALAPTRVKKMPTLADLKKSIPKGGLLNPGLRKMQGSKSTGPLDLKKLKKSVF